MWGRPHINDRDRTVQHPHMWCHFDVNTQCVSAATLQKNTVMSWRAMTWIMNVHLWWIHLCRVLPEAGTGSGSPQGNNSSRNVRVLKSVFIVILLLWTYFVTHILYMHAFVSNDLMLSVSELFQHVFKMLYKWGLFHLIDSLPCNLGSCTTLCWDFTPLSFFGVVVSETERIMLELIDVEQWLLLLKLL